MTVVAFLYGFTTAIITLIAALLIGFAKARSLTSDKLKALETAHNHPSNLADADAAAKLDPIKVTSVVKVSRFDHGYPGAVKNCRIVLLGSIITVYEVSGDNAGMQQQAGTTSTAGGAAGSPLGPSAAATTASHQLQAGERLLGKINMGSIVPILHNFAAAAPTATTTAAASANSKSVAAATAAMLSNNAMHGMLLVLKCRPPALQQDSAGSGGAHHHGVFLPQSVLGAGDERKNTSSLLPDEAMSCADDLPRLWTCIAIKFQSSRDLDRWANAISASTETTAWRKFVKGLPQLDVFNLFLARIFFENNSREGGLSRLIHSKIEAKLKVVSKTMPKPLSGAITVHTVDTGSEIPLMQNVSFVSYATHGELAFDFDMLYRGGFTVVLLAQLFVKSVQIPQLQFTIRLVELRGRMHISIGAPPSKKIWIGFHGAPNVVVDFKQDVTVHEGVLSAVMSLIPDLSEMITNIVKVQLFEDMILPKMDDVPIPNVEPSPPTSPRAKPSEPDVEAHAATVLPPSQQDAQIGPLISPRKTSAKNLSADLNSTRSSFSAAVNQPHNTTGQKSSPYPDYSKQQEDEEYVLVDKSPQSASSAQPQQQQPAARRVDSGLGNSSDLAGLGKLHALYRGGGGGHNRTFSGDIATKPGGVAASATTSPATYGGRAPVGRAPSPPPQPAPAAAAAQLNLPPPPMFAPVNQQAQAGRSTTPPPQGPEGSNVSASVKHKVDSVKAALAFKAAELRKNTAQIGGGGAEVGDGNSTAAAPQGASRQFLQPQWSTAKW